jgi:hypothetical protein
MTLGSVTVFWVGVGSTVHDQQYKRQQSRRYTSCHVKQETSSGARLQQGGQRSSYLFKMMYEGGGDVTEMVVKDSKPCE